MTGIEKMQIDPNQLFIQLSPDQPVQTPKQTGKENDRIEFSTDYQKYIRQSAEEEQVQSQKVLEARKALESGELDSLQAARLAAESLLQFGI